MYEDKQITSRRKVLSSDDYIQICNFIKYYSGLAIDCEDELRRSFIEIDRLTLKSILQTEIGNHLRSYFWRYEEIAKSAIHRLTGQSNADPAYLIKLACTEGISPVALCRAVLQQRYRFENKSNIAHLMKYPHLIENTTLSANVTQCLCSDSQDGPLIDLRRRVIGEEYEFKLKEMAKAAGMDYYDENDLRRLGYDKTPDIKMILPFLYEGVIVNWIESKATFGDVKTHKWYIQQQLNSYTNRFGPGIIIYWFGYHEITPCLKENSVGITVLDDFPDVKKLDFLSLNQ